MRGRLLNLRSVPMHTKRTSDVGLVPLARESRDKDRMRLPGSVTLFTSHRRSEASLLFPLPHFAWHRISAPRRTVLLKGPYFSLCGVVTCHRQCVACLAPVGLRCWKISLSCVKVATPSEFLVLDLGYQKASLVVALGRVGGDLIEGIAQRKVVLCALSI